MCPSSFHTVPLSQSGTRKRVSMHLASCLMCFSFFPVPCQLAESHYNLSLLRQCALGWHQSVKASQSDRQATADQLYQHLLLRRSLSSWKRVCICKRFNWTAVESTGFDDLFLISISIVIIIILNLSHYISLISLCLI